ncbi:hypothetical protein ACFVQ3_02900 [Oerskovia sp. NPDC057915]|uniref:hypothetical protein n=1 Tax=Oerskovia sp. NPDC057915 TaxID=3346280 RepID=UPI0036D99F00
MRIPKVVVGWTVAAVVVATPVVVWVASWTTTERTCLVESDVAPHTNRSRTYYDVRTSCGLLGVDEKRQSRLDDAIDPGRTYRMTIEDRTVAQWLIDVEEL